MPDTLKRLETALADRYLIQRELGRGGMAIVCPAEDLEHHRVVAQHRRVSLAAFRKRRQWSG